MRALHQQYFDLESKLVTTRDVKTVINETPVTLDFSYHSVKRGKDQEIYNTAITYMVHRAFEEILDLKNGDRFIVKDDALCISIVGVVETLEDDIIITIISAINGEARNPHGTVEITI